MSATPGLRIFGFPVDVRPGFLMLLALFAIYSSGAFKTPEFIYQGF